MGRVTKADASHSKRKSLAKKQVVRLFVTSMAPYDTALHYLRSAIERSDSNDDNNIGYLGKHEPDWDEWLGSRKTKGVISGVVVGGFLLACAALWCCRQRYKNQMASAEAAAKRDLEMRARMLY